MRYRQFLPYNAAGAILWAVAFLLLGYLLGNSWRLVEAWAARMAAVLAALLALGWLLRRRLHWPARIPVELAIIVLGACVFAAIAEDVVTGDRLTLVDQQLAQWLAAHRSSALTQGMLVVSRLHATAPIAWATMMVAIALIWRGDWRWLTALIAVVPTGMLLNVGLKHLFQRARPVLDEPLVTLATYSFPSGHVTGATLFYGFLCALVFTHAAAMPLRWLVAAASFLLVALVAFSRMYLGAHFLSDVLGAFVLGATWLVLSLAAVHGRLTRATFDRLIAGPAGDTSKKDNNHGQ